VATHVYRRKFSNADDPKYTVKTTKHPASVMAWGCFGYHGVGDLVILPKNEKVNQDVYLTMIMDHLPGSMETRKTEIFMQDGAPCHKAKSVTKWLDDCDVSYFKDWPGNSPDLNPIENLWALMKRRLRDMDTSSVPKLVAALQQLWTNFPPDQLRNLAMSVPKRLKQCIRARGNTIKYQKKG